MDVADPVVAAEDPRYGSVSHLAVQRQKPPLPRRPHQASLEAAAVPTLPPTRLLAAALNQLRL